MAIKTYSQKLLADTEAELMLINPSAGDTAFALDTGLSYLYNGTSWSPSSNVRLVRASVTLDCKTTGNTALLYTVPSGTTFRFLSLAAHVENISITGTVGIAPSISAGTNATTYNNIFTSSLLQTLLTGTTQNNALNIATTNAPLSAGTAIYARCNLAATLYTTYTVRVDIMGTYQI